MSQKTRRGLVCCTGWQTDQGSTRNTCPETQGLGAVERRSLRTKDVKICSDSFWCPAKAGMQSSIYLRTLIEMLIEMCRILNVTYPNRWTGRGGPVLWSPDLTPLDYFLWGSMKSMVYGTPVTSEEDLIA